MEVLGFLWICLVPLILIAVVFVGYRKYKELTEENDKLEKELRQSKQLVNDLRVENREKTIAEWFEEVKTATYRNETEVEIKFIYPLLKYLGHPNSNVEIRVPITIQVGRSSNRGEADWVVWNTKADSENRKALFVIEAKAQNQALTTEIQEQTRSYAYALNVPVYLCTNGKRIAIYRRGVESDICVVDCDVKELPDNWSDIRTILRSKGT